MALKEEQLSKFSKATELAVKFIEDDSSTEVTVKILNLVREVTATSSIPTKDGTNMKVKGLQVHVAQEDYKQFLAEANEVDGIIIYRGPMHLDVSRPRIRTGNDGNPTVTRTAQIWLTSVKFSRKGGDLRQKSQTTVADTISKMFAGGKTVDLSVPVETVGATGEGATEKKVEPEIVANVGG